ncbi:TrmH family RNA methyltransferase [Candidatus Azambacteria bacterium]|nr:TrmH family RNA methyltransferase [Candidatus Azambacteria bacterium]MBI3685170.1 TrmH family RNA methyltransferase [Candidatus Azambacteria bacterium]
MIAILHNIRSAHNVGSMFRTADAAGIEKLYLCGITPAPVDAFGRPSEKLRKVALGAEKSVAWEKVKSTARLIDKLKKDGFTIFAVEQSKKSVPYFRVKQKGKKIAIVMGNEVKGLPKSVLERADTILEIPMRGAMVRQAHHPRHIGRGKESLNVSVAFGIVAFHFAHQ